MSDNQPKLDWMSESEALTWGHRLKQSIQRLQHTPETKITLQDLTIAVKPSNFEAFRRAVHEYKDSGIIDLQIGDLAEGTDNPDILIYAPQ